jgi:hypothetical protein
LKPLPVILLTLLSFALFGQESDTLVPTQKRKLLDYFTKGQSHGHFRYFFMATDNAPGLSDYYAHAIGGGLRHETLPFYGFQLGVSGFYIFNIASSNLAKPDPKTGQFSRYETGQFDIENLNNRDDLDRLEELYLRYSYKSYAAVVGRQIIKTPFINPQDGRMRPTAVQGINLETKAIPRTKVNLMWLDGISPRGTVSWYSIGGSIGKYSQGRNVYGEQSDYARNIASSYVGILGIQHDLNPNWKLQAWNYYVDNVFNTAMIQADGLIPFGGTEQLVLGFQAIRQDVAGNGGNADPQKTYAATGWHANIFGGKIGVRGSHHDYTLSYTRITNDGRFLMPREWGREPLYTFIQRERNEGAGGVHAWVLRMSQWKKKTFRPEIAAGYYSMPAVSNALLNKYAMPSYWQINGAIKHEFEGYMQGMDVEIILLYKGIVGSLPENPSFVFNKVNLWHTNVILNYHF